MDTERHFKVIRFFSHPGHGTIERILGENLTWQEAQEISERNIPVISDEEVVIFDESLKGFDAEKKNYRSERPVSAES